jgi:hypothetical protein
MVATWRAGCRPPEVSWAGAAAIAIRRLVELGLKGQGREAMNDLQRHILNMLEADVKNCEAVIESIERGHARYRVNDRDTTEETLAEQKARVSERKDLIAKLSAVGR